MNSSINPSSRNKPFISCIYYSFGILFSNISLNQF